MVQPERSKTMNAETIEKLKNYLRLIQAQAATMAGELQPGNLWGSDESRKLGVIQDAVTQITLIRDYGRRG